MKEPFVRGAPDVVVEVSSPTTRRLDTVRKRDVYQRFGVPEYWFVDLDADRVEVHRLREGRYGPPAILLADDTLTTDLLPGFSIAVRDLVGD